MYSPFWKMLWKNAPTRFLYYLKLITIHSDVLWLKFLTKQVTVACIAFSGVMFTIKAGSLNADNLQLIQFYNEVGYIIP